MMRAAYIPRRFDASSADGNQSNKLPSLRPVVDQNLYSPHPKSGQTSSGFSLPLIVWTRPVTALIGNRFNVREEAMDSLVSEKR
jgi:hypothetical protein